MMPKKITTSDFINRSIQKHGDRYSYQTTKYAGMHNPVIVSCPVHGEFTQTADNHLRSNGCKKCAYEFTRYKHTRHTAQQFISKAINIHGNAYDYSEVVYENDNSVVKIICPEHGPFNQRASSHLQGSGCNSCSLRPRITNESFIDQAMNVHGTFYNYEQTKIINSQTPVKITCPIHGEFTQYPHIHTQGGQCPGCRPRGYSKASIEWLKWVEELENIQIQHAETADAEYRLPETNIFVDGFCHETQTVYEFYGDVFHGNPHIYQADERCGPSEKTAGELLTKTVLRENKIKTHYKIITIWESQWNDLKKSSRTDGYTLWEKIKRRHTQQRLH